MIGYIYVTKTTCGHYYIGQRKKQRFDESYFGSGKLLKGKTIESCEMIDSSESFYRLNEKERTWIRVYKMKHGDKCLNRGPVIMCQNGLVFVHKKTNIVVIGLNEMKYIYRIAAPKLRKILKGECRPQNGFHPEDWEVLSYHEYDVRRLNV